VDNRFFREANRAYRRPFRPSARSRM